MPKPFRKAFFPEEVFGIFSAAIYTFLFCAAFLSYASPFQRTLPELETAPQISLIESKLVPFHHKDFKNYFEQLWNLQSKSVNILDASAGEWTPTADCPTPRAWLFLSGNYRTFYYTRHNHLKMLQESDPIGSCFFVVAVVPWVVTIPGGHAGHPSMFSENWNSTSFLRPYLRDDAVLFGRKFAYVILERFGSADTYDGSFHMYWHGVWALARWAAKVNNFAIDPSSLVIRSRPDMSFENAFDFRKLINLFRTDSVAGPHLQIGQLFDSDLSMFTSFASYETDIAALVEHGLRTGNESHVALGMAGAWCRGRVGSEPPGCITVMDYGAGDTGSAGSTGHRFESCLPYLILAWDNHAMCRLASKSEGGYRIVSKKNFLCALRTKDGSFVNPKVDLFYGRCTFPVPRVIPSWPPHLRAGLVPGALVRRRVFYVSNGGWQECNETRPFTEVLRLYPFR